MTFLLRTPCAEDAVKTAELVHRCPPLDTNSVYCHLLQCSHFASTSIVAERAGQLVASISGYRRPDATDVLFIWQVAVAPEARGQGLARQMLNDVLARPENHGVRYIETTITADNQASWQLFTGWATRAGWPQQRRLAFDCRHHFAGQHPSEYLLRIGPMAVATAAPADPALQSGEPLSC